MVRELDAGVLRILIVDDEEDIRASLRRVLKRLPVEAVAFDEASTGEEAIGMLRKTAYHLILSDYRMGKVSGIDVLEIARLEHPSTVRILMTAFQEIEIAREAVNRARIEGFIRKPWENDKLLGLIENLLLERFPSSAA